MAILKVTGGALNVELSGGATDPGFGGGIGAGHPDNSLPPGMPPIGSTLPEPPPGIWPPLTPSSPIQPAPPGTPPGSIWPPIWTGSPGHPAHPLPPTPGRPDAGLPVQPGHPDAGLPAQPGHPSGGPVPPQAGAKPPESKVWYVVAGIPGVGWRYVAIDPSLVAGMPLPPAPEPEPK